MPMFKALKPVEEAAILVEDWTSLLYYVGQYKRNGPE